ncbi:MAG: NB-ARC domain-containing protein [Anaerolineales bacterium]
MAELGKKLGKLSLAILENFVEGTLGKKLVDELRAPTNRVLAIATALQETEALFISKFEDKNLSKALFVDLKQKDRPVLKDAVGKFFDHPTDPSLRKTLQEILFDEFKEILSRERIDAALDIYIRLLTKELMLADDVFRDNIAALGSFEGSLAEKKSAEYLEQIAAWIVQQQRISQQPIAPHGDIGFIPAAKAVTYVHRGKTEDDLIAFLRAGGNGAIVGLHAPGGLGKTELAKQAAEAVKDVYDDVLWVDVGENTSAQVINTMLIKCNIQSSPASNDEMKVSELRAYLQSRKLLVIFDDVRSDALAQMHTFLPPKPCSSLITTRIQQIGGIRTFALDHLSVEQARELMVAILGTEIVEAELEMADKLSERVTWNPLALEISARRILQLKVTRPITAFFKKVLQRFPELKMDGDERWDMRKIFDISYQDLAEEDQKRFRWLSVFHPTGFSPSAVARVWGLDEIETDHIQSRFINLSLIKPVPGDFERYRFHDLLDEYAWLLLTESGEVDEARASLCKWIIDQFDEHYTDDPSSAPEVVMELENLRLAAGWALNNQDGNMLALLATKPRNWLFNVFRLNEEWETWLQSALKLGVENQGLRANVLQAIGDVQQFRDDRDAALESYNEALKLFKAVGDRLGEANVYLSLGGFKRTEKDFTGARTDFQNAFNIYELIGDRYSQARALYRLGDCLSDEEKFQEALNYYEQSAELWHSIGVNELVEGIINPRIEEARKHL